jgi:predicted nucleic acid-binding protein
MAELPCVLDTSVAAAWFFLDEPSRIAALGVRSQVYSRPGYFVVPHLFYSELVHVVSRKSGSDRQFVERVLAVMISLGLRTLPLSEKALGRLAHWSCLGLSGYDATHVALAEDLGGVWLTLDKRAAKRAGAKRPRFIPSRIPKKSALPRSIKF